MAYPWSANDILTAADLNAAFATLNGYFPLGAGAWTSYVPTLTQSATVTKTASYCVYQKVGRIVTARFVIGVTGTGTAANAVVVGTPVAAVFGAGPVGTGYIYDASTGIFHHGVWDLATGSTMRLVLNGQTNFAGVAGFTAALANTDGVHGVITYESSS